MVITPELTAVTVPRSVAKTIRTELAVRGVPGIVEGDVSVCSALTTTFSPTLKDPVVAARGPSLTVVDALRTKLWVEVFDSASVNNVGETAPTLPSNLTTRISTGATSTRTAFKVVPVTSATPEASISEPTTTLANVVDDPFWLYVVAGPTTTG
jgi:hypothetical protein